MSPHFFLALALAFTLTASAPAVEPWADPKLPVTDGLELWLEPRGSTPRRRRTRPASRRTASSRSGSTAPGRAGTSGSRSRPRSPTLMKVGDAAIVRFDGDDDHLRLTGGKEELKAFTAFVVVAPRRNLGGFPGFFALNAPNGRDYETGFNIDMGPNPTPRFTRTERRGPRLRRLAEPADRPAATSASSTSSKCAAEAKADSRSRSMAPPTASGRGRPSRSALAEITVGARLLHQRPRHAGGPRLRPAATSPRCCSTAAPCRTTRRSRFARTSTPSTPS